jgi:fucose 4-O-acetylase-like acetyltransferase
MPTSQIQTSSDLEQPASWSGVAAGLLIFAVAAAFLLISEIPSQWGLAEQPALSILVYWGMLLIPASGVCAGWIQEFPRWSYPYAGLAVLIALFMTNATTPGLTVFNYPTFDRQIWGCRALIPLALAGVVGLAVTCSFQPVRKFFAQMSADRTLAVYLMTGFLPIVVFIAFDEVDSPYTLSTYWIVCAILFVMATVYLRSRTFNGRARTLITGTLAILLITSISVSMYWYRLNPKYVYLPGMIGWTLCLTGFILWPLATPGLARVINRFQGDRAS